jgi:transcription antitermination protein NusB
VGSRRLGREMALQMLYAVDVNPSEEFPAIPQATEESKVSFESLDFAEELLRGVREHRARIDEIISEKSKNWSLERISKVDLGILRMAIFELLFRDDIPKNVTINEAIEVAKKFGSKDSPAFINGILDEVATGLSGKE